MHIALDCTSRKIIRMKGSMRDKAKSLRRRSSLCFQWQIKKYGGDTSSWEVGIGNQQLCLYYSEKIGIEKVSYATYTLIQKLENSGHLFTRVPGGKTTIFLAKLQSVFVSKNDYGTLP